MRNKMKIERYKVSEKEFRAQVMELVKLFSWKYYFTWNSIRSPKGFPDLVLVKDKRLIFAELKNQDAKLTESQQEWIDILSKLNNVEVYVWRPDDLVEISNILKS